MNRRKILFIIFLITIIFLLNSCLTKETKKTESEKINIESLPNIEETLDYWTLKREIEIKKVLVTRGIDIESENVKKAINEEIVNYKNQLKKKLDSAPESLKNYMKSVVLYDRIISKNINLKKLEELMLKGKITREEIVELYKKEAERIGFTKYISEMFEKDKIIADNVYVSKGVSSSLRHKELSTLRPGDVLIIKSTSSGDNSSGSSSGGGMGHAAIWTELGDLKLERLAKVAMAAWYKPPSGSDAPHEKYEVGYDYRQLWSGKIVKKNEVIYGMYVRKWVKKGWFSGYWKKTSDSEALNAANYAKKQRGKKYPDPVSLVATTKLNTNTFYCSSLVWRSWKEQEIDLDPKWWPLNQLYVSPDDIYSDDNTVMKFSYTGIN
ncbi:MULTISPECIES: hypothetical protein [unclassified Marinitoga]|uniref:hypothetical protein n=1 Tax=unclassified Marinitoga TaxID=2640159 RepID=UPI0006412F49|nr:MULTISPECIES: hypothetical protein [unclassified Marinitoga]KLO22535.1 hypothetical protein X274_07980 [Marinitoga sp. 1155]NUV00483.1 hypothetical protein [Marinitoga sp. 1154]